MIEAVADKKRLIDGGHKTLPKYPPKCLSESLVIEALRGEKLRSTSSMIIATLKQRSRGRNVGCAVTVVTLAGEVSMLLGVRQGT